MIAEQTELSSVYVVTTNEPPKKKSIAAATIRAALATNTPGSWASDHRTETEQFAGWHYVGVHAIAIQAFQAEISVYDDGQDGDDLTTPEGGAAESGFMRQTGNRAAINAIGQSTTDFPKPSRQQKRDWLKKTFGSKWKAMAAAQNEQAAEALPDSHKLVKLLKRPNPTQSGGMLLYELAQQLELTGSAILVTIPNGLGQPAELYCVPTAVAEPRPPSKDMPHGGYWINPAMARSYPGAMDKDGFTDMRGFYRLIGCVVPAEQCVIIRWPHPVWKDDGQSPVAAAALWTDTANMIDKARWGHLRRGPDPSIAVGLSEEYNPEQSEIDRFKASLQADYGGADKSGNVMVVPHGVSVDTLTTSPKDMSYDTGFLQLRDSLLAIHQVPAIAAGISDGGSFAAFVASLRQFITLKVQPLLSLIAQELTSQVAKLFGPQYTVEIDAATVDDPEQIEKMLATDIAGGLRKRNEARALRGLPMLPGPEGEELLGQGGMGAGVPGFDANPLKPGNQPPPGSAGTKQGFGDTPGDHSSQFPDGAGTPKEGDDLTLPQDKGGDKDGNAAAFGDKSRMQWKRNIAAINDVVEAVEQKKYSETRAVVMLMSLGLPENMAKLLVMDAMDGKTDDPQSQQILQQQPAADNIKRTYEIQNRIDRNEYLDTRNNLPPIRRTITAVDLKADRKFSSTQFNLSGALRRQVLRLSEQIDPRDLAEDGIEDEPHITVKYGLLTDDPREVKAILAGTNPVQVRFGSLSVFENEDADVLKVNVDGESLTQLHNLISDSLDHTSTHPDYQPHVTVAYLKPGRGRKYAEELQNNLEDQTATFDRLVFSDTKKNHSYLRLGVPALAKTEHNGNGHANGSIKSLLLEQREAWMEDVKKVLTSAGVLKSSDCGANAEGGGGFQPGNTCGKEDGGGSEAASSGGKKHGITVSEARYANGKLAVSVPSKDGWATDASRMAHAVGGKFSNRENAYIMSKAQADNMQRLLDSGWTTTTIERKLVPPGGELEEAMTYKEAIKQLNGTKAAEKPATASEGDKTASDTKKPAERSVAAPTGLKHDAISPEVEAIEAHYVPANPKGVDSFERHKGEDGKFTPARKALHDKIVNDILSGKPTASNKTFTMMGGGPAAGKSSIVDAGSVSLPKGHALIDADGIKGKLPEWDAMLKAKDSRAAAYLHEESSFLAKRIMAESFNKGINAVLDGTGNASVKSVEDKINKARAAGYRVEGEYVTASIEEALRRAAARGEKTGRVVPPSIISGTHKSVSAILPQVADKFDRVRLWDTENPSADGKPALVMSAEGGKMVIHNEQLWQAFKDKANWKPKD